VDGGRPGFQRGHVDAARRSGLAGADAPYPSRCVSAGYRDGSPVCSATAVSALDGIGCGPPQPAEAPDADPGNDGRACALMLGVLTIAGVVRLWHVYVFAFLSGSAAALDAPVRQTFVAEMVGDADLHNAVALNHTSFNAAQMIGPAVAGLLIAKVGIGWAFLLNGLSFAAVLISMSFFRLWELRPRARAHRTTSRFLEGLRYVWRRPDLRAILIMLFLIGTFGLNFPIFISTMAVTVFDSDARGFALLSSIMAVGTISGALFAAGRQRSSLASLLLGAGVFGLGCTLAALAPGYWWFGAALMIIGAAGVIFTNGTNSIMQLSTEPAMRGRVMALRVGVALGGTPIGAPIVGWVANHFGPRWALGIGAGAGFAAALVAVYVLGGGKKTVLAQ
jgi:MFS family permease